MGMRKPESALEDTVDPAIKEIQAATRTGILKRMGTFVLNASLNTGEFVTLATVHTAGKVGRVLAKAPAVLVNSAKGGNLAA
jgi:hypothetical protein